VLTFPVQQKLDLDSTKRKHADTGKFRLCAGSIQENYFKALAACTSSHAREMVCYQIEHPSSKLQGVFDRKERCYFVIRSLTHPQAAGNALAYAVHT
jgi:hypothetical protein